MLTTQSTVLRAPLPADYALLFRLRNDLTFQTNLMSLMRANSQRRVEEWVEGVLGDQQSLFFVIAAITPENAIGFVQMRRIDFVHGHGELGIGVTSAAQGQGHAFDAINLLETYARGVFNLRKVVLQVLATNNRAVRLYEKCGYRSVGTMASHFYHDGVFHDVLVMEHLLARSTE